MRVEQAVRALYVSPGRAIDSYIPWPPVNNFKFADYSKGLKAAPITSPEIPK